MTRQLRRRLAVIGVAAALGVASPVWGPRVLRTVPAFYVSGVEVTGARFVDADAARGLAAIPPEASVWDDHRAAERLGAVPFSGVLVRGTHPDGPAAKAGLLEIADVFVVNKCDRPGAAETVRDLEGSLDLAAPRPWRPPVIETFSMVIVPFSRRMTRSSFSPLMMVSPVAGFRPILDFRAGFFTRRILTPVSGMLNSPEPRRCT